MSVSYVELIYLPDVEQSGKAGMPDEEGRFEPLEVHGHPHRTGRFWFDFIAASAAVLIAVISLVVAIRGEGTQRKLLAASSWPFLQTGKDEVYGGNDTIDLQNAGVGPAKIIWFEMYYDRKPVSLVQLLDRCCGLSRDPEILKTQIPHGLGYSPPSGQVLRAGDTMHILTVRRDAGGSTVFGRFDEMSSARMSLRSCYCSVLDECWVSDFVGLHTKPVATCPTPAHPLVLGDLAFHR